ncbi:helix-turn-helix domain-containing protein [Micromonospora carbonacea]|uniref:helix-turn-helix domain-containing protein n=1 Tax=Micromonospora carbonacea TaxID=47853 RepID=UPI003719B0A4
MRAPTDLHPDDREARLALRALLITARKEAGHSQASLAAILGCTQTAVARYELGEFQRINPARRIAHHLGLRIVMFPDGVPGGPYDDPAMLAFRPAEFTAASVWDQQHLMSGLVTARRACGHTQASLARLLGTTENALGEFERSPHVPLFGSVQRYCRPLGGWLWLGVESLRPVGAVAA